MTVPESSSRAPCAIGIDIGGTKCAGGIVLMPEGRVVTKWLHPTGAERGGAAVLADVVSLAQSLQQEAGRQELDPAAVGLGVAELVSVDGKVLSEATIRWKGVDVREKICAATGLHVTVEADVRAAARGEAHFGSGGEFRSFLYVTIGTGISACFVQNGTPYAGARGLTGTFASSRGLIPGDDGELATGPPLESYAGGPALASRFAAEREHFTGSAREVIQLAEAGDPAARKIVDTAARAVGGAIANLVNMLDPEGVIIGGGLGSAEGCYRNSLVDAVRAHIWSDFHRDLPIHSAGLGNDAGFVGAALAAARP